VKCHLRPLNVADYDVTFTPDELARLHAIFPTGACDYSRPSLDQHGLAGTWLEYVDVGQYRRDQGGPAR
jgi:hypothetical protein